MNMKTQWYGKTIAFLGDSVTEGVAVAEGECYWNYLEKILGCKSKSYGKNGATFGALKNQAIQLWNDCGNDIDAVVLFAGTNDYCAGRELGNWYEPISEEKVLVGYKDDIPCYELRKHRIFNMNSDTFRGNVNIVISEIRKLYPTKQLILITPLHRAYASFGKDNIQPDELYANKSGIFFDEYVSVIKEAANIWACELIDLNAVSGLFPLNDVHAKMFFSNQSTDRLHPNRTGYIRIADAMAYKLKNIPVFL